MHESHEMLPQVMCISTGEILHKEMYLPHLVPFFAQRSHLGKLQSRSNDPLHGAGSSERTSTKIIRALSSSTVAVRPSHAAMMRLDGAATERRYR